MWIHVVIFVMILCALTGWKKGWIPSYGIGGKDGIRLFAVVAIAGNLLGMILTLQNGGQVYPQGYRLEKEDTGSYEKEFMVSVDGEEPVSMYIQVPEKELEEQEEEPKQNKKLTRKEQAQKSIAEAVSRYNEQRSDPDYYYLPDKLNGKKVKWESPADTSGMLLTGLFLIAAMAILVMKGREEQVQLQKRYEELLMDYPGLIMKFTLLVQAGMTVRKAFQKISLDYGRKRKRNPRPAYEEIRIVCYEMESGVLKVKHTEDLEKDVVRQSIKHLPRFLSRISRRAADRWLICLKENQPKHGKNEREKHVFLERLQPQNFWCR